MRTDILALDKDEAWLLEKVVGPRSRGEDSFISGRVIAWKDVEQLQVTHTERASAELLPGIRARRQREGAFTLSPDEWYVAYEGDDVTERYISGVPGHAASAAPATTEMPAAEDRASVMVVHGQDAEAAEAMFGWLQKIGLRPQEWEQLRRSTGEASPFIGRVLQRAFEVAQAVVVLFTPDERVQLRHELAGGEPDWRLQARPNVHFEAGMALAAQPDRTVLAVLGEQELPSDLAGRHYVRLGSEQSLNALAQRLEDAGCSVDRTGGRWLRHSFPNRDGLPADADSGDQPASPRSRAGRPASANNPLTAGQRLLATNDELVRIVTDEVFIEAHYRSARQAFDSAQIAVLIAGTEPLQAAAEALRAAWNDRGNSRYRRSAWGARLESAREQLVLALRAAASE